MLTGCPSIISTCSKVCMLCLGFLGGRHGPVLRRLRLAWVSGVRQCLVFGVIQFFEFTAA